jgi:hypothetical protein
MKSCTKCAVEKPLGEFYRKGGARTGARPECKKCTNAENARYGNSERGKEVRKGVIARYLASAKGKATIRAYQDSERGRAIIRAAHRRWRRTPEGRRAHRAHVRRSARRYPERILARLILNHAVASGLLKRPKRCKCGSPEPIQAHHQDYAKPLEVEWLCLRCHVALRRRVA